MIKYRARVTRRFFYQFHYGPCGGSEISTALLTSQWGRDKDYVEYSLDLFLVEIVLFHINAISQSDYRNEQIMNWRYILLLLCNYIKQQMSRDNKNIKLDVLDFKNLGRMPAYFYHDWLSNSSSCYSPGIKYNLYTRAMLFKQSVNK